MPGWIKLYRKLLDSDMYKSLTSKQRDVLIAVLLMVNFEKKKWEWGGEVFECNPGQCITSLDSILKKCAKEMKVQSVRTALLKLARWGFLTNVSTKTGRLITILNWSEYQSDNYDINKVTNKELTKRQQSSNKELTSSKKYKEVKEGKEEEIKEGGTDDRDRNLGNDNGLNTDPVDGSQGLESKRESGFTATVQENESTKGQHESDADVRGIPGNYGDDNNGRVGEESLPYGGSLNGPDNAKTRTGLDVPGPGPNDDIHAGDNSGSDGDSVTVGSGDGQAPIGKEGAEMDREEVGDGIRGGEDYMPNSVICNDSDRNSNNIKGVNHGVWGLACSGDNRRDRSVSLSDNEGVDHGMVDNRGVDAGDHGGVPLPDKGGLNHDLLEAKKKDEAKQKPAKKKPKKPKNGFALDLSTLDAGFDPSVVEEFIDYRKTVKKSALTQHALAGVCRNAKKTSEAHGGSFSDALVYAMENNWLTPDPKYIDDNKPRYTAFLDDQHGPRSDEKEKEKQIAALRRRAQIAQEKWDREHGAIDA